LLNLTEVHEVALGDASGSQHLVPGKIDGGFSRIVTDNATDDAGYDVQVVRLDDVLSSSGRTLAIKIDVEHYECNVLAGMERTLRENRCFVQIEAFETRDQVISIMAAAGYDLVADLSPNLVFDNANARAPRAVA
jgi:FkbM family methyltransferase